MKLIDKKLFITFVLMIGITLLSFLGFLFPSLNSVVFIAIILSLFATTIYDIKLSLLVAFGELFIGSKGYLFSLDINGQSISLRIGIWFTIMAVYFSCALFKMIKDKKVKIHFKSSKFFALYMVLFISMSWGLINGFIKNNNLNNIFFDFNGWMYFTYILPVYSLAKIKIDKDRFLADIFSVLKGAVLWLSIFSLITFYLFEHNLVDIILPVYQWYRKLGIGEITRTENGFHRIFIQSQIFSFVIYFWILLSGGNSIKQYFRKDNILKAIYLILITSSILLSFSRSFWFGLFFGFIALLIVFLKNKTSLKDYLVKFAYLLSMAILSVLLIIAVAKFPYPRSFATYDTFDLITKRAQQISGEAGAASRWSLLPKLEEKIKNNLILGAGYGSTVTYKTSDPRILENNPSGEYTTYAFEWGWLDIWLKIGIIGFICYALLILKTYYGAITKYTLNDPAVISFTIALITICFVSIFSPYTNHPLGIGLLILTTFFVDTKYLDNI